MTMMSLMRILKRLPKPSSKPIDNTQCRSSKRERHYF
jgi:hypothetical protein